MGPTSGVTDAQGRVSVNILAGSTDFRVQAQFQAPSLLLEKEVIVVVANGPTGTVLVATFLVAPLGEQGGGSPEPASPADAVFAAFNPSFLTPQRGRVADGGGGDAAGRPRLRRPPPRGSRTRPRRSDS